MEVEMLLANKSAVVYGVGDSLGGAVAKAFAAAGATVFLTARHVDKAARVAQEIEQSGGKAHVAQVDALDEQAVNAHLEEVRRTVRSLDVSFNLICMQDRQDIPLIEMKMDDFLRPVQT